VELRVREQGSGETYVIRVNPWKLVKSHLDYATAELLERSSCGQYELKTSVSQPVTQRTTILAIIRQQDSSKPFNTTIVHILHTLWRVSASSIGHLQGLWLIICRGIQISFPEDCNILHRWLVLIKGVIVVITVYVLHLRITLYFIMLINKVMMYHNWTV
jgi:hypothetical protein